MGRVCNLTNYIQHERKSKWMLFNTIKCCIYRINMDWKEYCSKDGIKEEHILLVFEGKKRKVKYKCIMIKECC